MEGEEPRGGELAEEGERLQTGVALWSEPCCRGGRADPSRGGQQRDRNEARGRTYRRASAVRADRPQCQARTPKVLPPPPPPHWLEAWRSQRSHLQEGLLAFSLLPDEVPQVLKLGQE